MLRQALSATAPLLILAGLWLGFAVAIALGDPESPRPWDFLSYRTTATILVQTATVAVAACGMTLVIAIGGIDLAVGSVLALACVVMALGLGQGWHPALAGLLALGAGAACGLVSGGLVAGARLMPFIVTLGMLGAARGAAKLDAGSQSVTYDNAAFPWFESLMTPVAMPGEASLLGSLAHDPLRVVAPGVWVAVAMVAATTVVLRWTVFGRHALALGSNPAAARLCGVRCRMLTVAVYVLCGATAAMAGILETARIHVGDPTTAPGRELDVIAAVVIGGASLSGGRGSAIGAAIGALMMTVLRTGAQRMGWDPAWQEVIIGAVIGAAIALDRMRQQTRT